jgi:hypothetical protein
VDDLASPPTEQRTRVAPVDGARLMCTYGPCEPTSIRLGAGVLTIGRQEGADIIVPASQISRLHASISHSAQGYAIVDLNSRNGTFVNAEPVREIARQLRNGDEIVLAGVASFRFFDGTPSSNAASPAALQRGVRVDISRHAVFVDGLALNPPLSSAQFMLLALLYKRTGAIVARAEIARAVWPEAATDGVSTDAVDCLIKRVRARIRSGGAGDNTYVEVVRGHGVRLKDRV